MNKEGAERKAGQRRFVEESGPYGTNSTGSEMSFRKRLTLGRLCIKKKTLGCVCGGAHCVGSERLELEAGKAIVLMYSNSR